MKRNEVDVLAHQILRHHQTLIINTVTSWCKNRPIDQWNRIDSSKTGHLLHGRGSKAVLWGEDVTVSKHVTWLSVSKAGHL